GTCFSDGKPRFIQIKGINLDAEVGEHMVYTTNADAPGIIGLLRTVCGKNNVNIANFQLGRDRPGGDSIALLYHDATCPEKGLEEVRARPTIKSAKPLRFAVTAWQAKTPGSPEQPGADMSHSAAAAALSLFLHADRLGEGRQR